MFRALRFAAALSALLLPGTGFATTLTFSDSVAGILGGEGLGSARLSVTPFDNTLGTLTSVDWRIEVDVVAALTVRNDQEQTLSDRNVSVATTLQFFDFQPINAAFSLPLNTGQLTYAPGQQRQFFLPGQLLRSRTESQNLDRWVDGRNASFNFGSPVPTILRLGAGTSALTAEQATFAELSFTVTYNFNPAEPDINVIPLPAAGWLLLSALLCFGAVSQRRGA